ncbi:hypothetical protein [Humitalea rosea]|uniref:hypothetical protein n=1 Tax=Humitalea rosea TaxID=990373 RepID=UPI00131457CF|nr:hypothetical protein [Humitalea rosea]
MPMLNGGCRLSRFVALAPALAVVLMTSGCAMPSFLRAPGAPIETSAIPARPMEPLALFASRAAPGQEDRVEPAAGSPPVPVRLIRAWNAGSGRECREVAIGGTREATRQVFCQHGASWEAARPLLRSGGSTPRT